MKKITYIISEIDKAIAFEWVVHFINKEKFSLSFILINSENSYLGKFLAKENIPVFHVKCSNKFHLPIAIFNCYNKLKKIKPDIVHCHLFHANLIGLTAAKLANIRSRIFTRHYSTYHHDYFPKTVKWDRQINKLSTTIIAISENVKNVLIENEQVNPEKITLIHHGFDLPTFEQINEGIFSSLTNKYNPRNKYPVIGVISRFTELKGIQFIIPAFQKLLQYYPDALLLMFNAHGDFESQIDSLLENQPKDSFSKIKFENEITSLYKLFDVFIHVPVDKQIEAFGQTYVEALASGTPSIFTLSGVANEFIKDRENALVVPYKNADAIFDAMVELLKDDNLKNKLIENGKLDVCNRFKIEIMISKLEKLYDSL